MQRMLVPQTWKLFLRLSSPVDWRHDSFSDRGYGMVAFWVPTPLRILTPLRFAVVFGLLVLAMTRQVGRIRDASDWKNKASRRADFSFPRTLRSILLSQSHLHLAHFRSRARGSGSEVPGLEASNREHGCRCEEQ